MHMNATDYHHMIDVLESDSYGFLKKWCLMTVELVALPRIMSLSYGGLTIN